MYMYVYWKMVSVIRDEIRWNGMEWNDMDKSTLDVDMMITGIPTRMCTVTQGRVAI